MKCQDCTYYRVHRRNGKDSQTGSCKRFPPSPVALPERVETKIQSATGPQMRMSIKAAWVTVLGSDCCGEFKAKEETP